MSEIVTHKYVTTQWSTPGFMGREDCVCCGFTMLGDNRVLTVRHRHGRGRGIALCDGCVNAIATRADGREVRMDGSEKCRDPDACDRAGRCLQTCEG